MKEGNYDYFKFKIDLGELCIINRNVSIIERRFSFVLRGDARLKIVFVVLNVKEDTLEHANLWSIKNLFINCTEDKD